MPRRGDGGMLYTPEIRRRSLLEALCPFYQTITGRCLYNHDAIPDGSISKWPVHLQLCQLRLITSYTMLSLLGFLSVAMALAPPLTVQDHFQTAISDDVKVPVVLGVMSRCPDAILCESVFNRVLQREGDKVAISLSFIAKYVHA